MSALSEGERNVVSVELRSSDHISPSESAQVAVEAGEQVQDAYRSWWMWVRFWYGDKV